MKDRNTIKGLMRDEYVREDTLRMCYELKPTEYIRVK